MRIIITIMRMTGTIMITKITITTICTIATSPRSASRVSSRSRAKRCGLLLDALQQNLGPNLLAREGHRAMSPKSPIARR